MVKRVVWICSAVLLIAVGTAFYVATSRTLLGVYPDVRAFSAVLLLVVAFVLRRRASVAARVLMLCGSIGLVIAYAHDWFLKVGMEHNWYQIGGDGWILYGYGEFRENPVLAIPANLLRMVGFCSPSDYYW